MFFPMDFNGISKYPELLHVKTTWLILIDRTTIQFLIESKRLINAAAMSSVMHILIVTKSSVGEALSAVKQQGKWNAKRWHKIQVKQRDGHSNRRSQPLFNQFFGPEKKTSETSWIEKVYWYNLHFCGHLFCLNSMNSCTKPSGLFSTWMETVAILLE